MQPVEIAQSDQDSRDDQDECEEASEFLRVASAPESPSRQVCVWLFWKGLKDICILTFILFSSLLPLITLHIPLPVPRPAEFISWML